MKCPGQDTQYWKPGAIFEVPCPACARAVEFFKDDTTRKCPHCGHRFVNPQMDFGCATYCQYAEQCLGDMPPELLAQKEDLLKDRVALAMKRQFRTDFRRIGHATRVARYAEAIGKAEQANLAVILAAAYLNDIGMAAGDSALGGNGVTPHETSGVAIARQILASLDAQPQMIEAVCDIVGRSSHPGEHDPLELKVVHDADRIATMEEAKTGEDPDRGRLEQLIETELYTQGGRNEARRLLL